jgi:hypothetical protein
MRNTLSNLWILPSTHGDIKLERLSKRSTRVTSFELTADEERAMRVLRDRAVTSKWSDEDSFLPLTHASYRTSKGASVVLDASLESVEFVLSGALKPDRTLVRAVRYRGGEIVQVVAQPGDTKDPLDRELDEMAAAELAKDRASAALAKVETPAVAATVAQPTVGCPVPDFQEADARASLVLESFLTPAQTADYRARGAFVCRGVDTGKNYLICNREGPARIREQALNLGLFGRESFRQIFDLDERRALCIHDWTVPPPEEMLALMLCLTLPGLERQMLRLPEVF